MQRTIHNPILNDTVTFLRTASETAGTATELEAVVQPGGSNPSHFHTTYTETITVLEGRILLCLAKGKEVQLTQGETYVLPPNTVHGFCNATAATVRVRSRITPGSEGFETALRILYGLAADGLYNKRKMPRSLQHFAVCASISDSRLPGLLSIANPLINLIARFARSRGIEQQLRQKYCV